MEISKTRLKEDWKGFLIEYKRLCKKMLMYPDRAGYYKKQAEKILSFMWGIEDRLTKEEVEQLYKDF